jgi:hypothetical protein
MIDRFMAKPGFVFAALLGAAAVGVSPGVSLAQEGAQLTGAEIAALVTGKTIVYRSDKRLTGTGPDARVVPRTDGGFAEVSMYMRTDGSFRMQCANVSRSGDRSPCPRLPGGDVGAWRIRGDAMCVMQLVREAHEQCFAYHRHGDGYRFRQVSGPPGTGDGASFVVK